MNHLINFTEILKLYKSQRQRRSRVENSNMPKII